MNILKGFKLATLAAALAGMLGVAHAAPCSVGDVTYGVDGPPGSAADACVGSFGGNINGSAAGTINDLGGLFAGAEFVLGDATDEPSGAPYLGNFTFTLTAPQSTTGVYTLTATDNNGLAPPNLPLFLDFAIALKAAEEYAVYLFDDVEFDGTGGGNFTTNIAVNKNGGLQDLSHMIAFVREGSSDTTSQTTSLTVSEPGSSSLALLGLGLVGFGFLQRRKLLGR